MDQSERYLESHAQEGKGNPLHYYGDIVRRLFVVGAIGMLVYVPYESAHALLPISVFSLVFLAIIITFLAGFTNPRERWTVLFDTITSGVLCLIFEYFAIAYYMATPTFFDPVFIVRQLLAVNFLVALYFSSKSLRGMSQ